MASPARLRLRAVYVKVIAFFAASAFLLLLLANTMADRVDGETKEYRAEFTDVSGLRLGDDVRVAGVQVGKITGIEVNGSSGDTAMVTFTLQESQPLLSNTTLVMRYQNLLGQRYLSLVQPARRGDEVEEGTTIPLERTSPGFDLTALLNGFRPLFDVLEPDDVNKLAESVIKVLQGEGGTVADLLDQTAQLTTYLADRDDLFTAVFDNLTPVLTDLAGQGNELRGTIRKLTTFMSGLAKHRRMFGQTIDDIAHVIDTSEAFLRNVRGPLAADVQKAKDVLRMYAAEEPRFAGAIDGFGSLMGTLSRVLSYRNALTFYFCDLDLDLGALTVRTSTLPGGYSEVCR
ncbi:MCE family protein [Nocardioides antri]|uniref:MCE family protein n=1 Tax=Nocardioides antri TaxID=2607659 RepID=A0A5B1M220_9ACTN|nr:MCE family protein [Nocardioides antri]KAA1426983.1 MCE family protein [Nocardioides antri]